MKNIFTTRDFTINEVEAKDIDLVKELFKEGEKCPWVWEDDVESAFTAIKSGNKSDYLARYPYQDFVENLDDFDIACLLHPLFIIETQGTKLLLITPPLEDMPDVYFTQDGEYLGEEGWEPLDDIAGEEISNEIINNLYSYLRSI